MMIKQTVLILLAAFGLLASGNSTEWSAPGIILSDGPAVARYSNPDTASISAVKLSSGDQVTILDSTSQVFNIGIGKEAPPVRLVKVSDKKGNVSWVSGQFVFQISKKKIVARNAGFWIHGIMYKIYSGRNFVVGPVNKAGRSKFAQFYPILAYDNAKGEYYPLLATDNPVYTRKKMTNPHSTYKYCSLVDNVNLQEGITKVSSVDGRVSLSINGKYQRGLCTYMIEISINSANELISKAVNYEYDDGISIGNERPQY